MSSGNGSSGFGTGEVQFEDIFDVSPEVAAVAGPRVRDLLKEFFLAQLDETVEILKKEWAELDALIGQAQAAMKKRPMDLAATKVLVQRAVYQGQKCQEDTAHIWRAIDIARERELVVLTDDDLVAKIGASRPQPSEASVTA